MPRPGEVDVSFFMEMCGSLSRMSCATFQSTLDYEVSRVVEKTIALLPAASVSKIRANHEASPITAQPDSLYAPQSPSGKRARAKARRTKNGKLKYYLANRYPDALWSQIEARRQKSLRAKLKARGLAKHSFFAITAALDLDVRIPGYVKKAVARTGRDYDARNVSVSRRTGLESAGIAFEDRQPTVNLAKIGGARALQRAINGRVRYFERNLVKKVFDSAKDIARRYPGVTTS